VNRAPGVLFRATERNLNFSDEDYIVAVCTGLREWMREAEEGTETTVEAGQFPNYILHCEIRGAIQQNL
jgi:hypothetical protein